MASVRDTLTKLLASDKPEPGTPLAKALGQYPFQQGEAPLEAPMFSPDDLIGTGIGKAALVGAGKAMPLIAGTFIGPKSKLWNTEAHALAQALEAKGTNPESIWNQTGTGRGLDKQWRQEISDLEAKFETPNTIKNKINNLAAQDLQSKELLKSVNQASKTNADLFPKQLNVAKKELKDNIKINERELGNNKVILDKLEYNSPFLTKSENFYSHPDLYNAYPELKSYPLNSKYEGHGYYGSFNGPGNGVDIYKNAFEEGKAPSTAAHEFQHAIQEIEGFNRGGNVSEGSTYLQNHLPEQYMQYISESNPTKQYEMARDAYRKLGGEAEARLTQNRLHMNEDQRRMFYPFKYLPEHGGLDIQPNEALIRGLKEFNK
jgi:hypothetical protein